VISQHNAERSAPSIAVAGLVVERGKRQVLRNIDLTVRSGRLVGLLGPSGCGKSTLMRAIVGVQRVASGSVEVLGLNSGDRRLRDRVAYTTQAPALYPDLTVVENIKYFARILGLEDGEVDRVVDAVDLGDHVSTQARNLSGGERARAALATALLGKPQLLVLDEPTVGLDPILRRRLWGLFAELVASGVTLLVSSHVLDEADHCEDIILLRDGSVIASEPRDTLLARAKTDSMEEAFINLVRQTGE